MNFINIADGKEDWACLLDSKLKIRKTILLNKPIYLVMLSVVAAINFFNCSELFRSLHPVIYIFGKKNIQILYISYIGNKSHRTKTKPSENGHSGYDTVTHPKN